MKLPEYDTIWCVFDVEVPKQDSLDQAIDKARSKLTVALSNPCFEYWLLLHFLKTASPAQSSKEMKKSVKKYHRGYKSGDTSILDIVIPAKDKAIKWAKQIENEMGWGKDLRKHNPSTHVHRLVEYLVKMAE